MNLEGPDRRQKNSFFLFCKKYNFMFSDRCLELQFLGLFPGKVRVISSKVAEGSSFGVDGAEEVQVTEDDTSTQVKVLVDNIKKVGVSPAILDGAIRVNVDGEGRGNTDGVGNLDEDTVAKASSDKGLGNPSASVGTRAINLGRVLSRESTSTMGSPPTIGVNDDLPASQTSISHGSTDNERARGVDVVDGVVSEELSGDDLVDDLSLDGVEDVIVGESRVVLGGDNNGVDFLGNALAVLILLVLDGDLGLGIRAEPLDDALLAAFNKAGAQTGGKGVGKRHQLFGLVGGVPEHVALVTSTNVLGGLGAVAVDRVGNLRGLLSNGNNDGTGLVVEALVRAVNPMSAMVARATFW